MIPIMLQVKAHRYIIVKGITRCVDLTLPEEFVWRLLNRNSMRHA